MIRSLSNKLIIIFAIAALLWAAHVYGSDLRTVSGGSGTGIVETIVPGGNISVDATDPANPIVSATSTTTLPWSAITGTPIVPTAHSQLTGTGVNTHDQLDTHLSNTLSVNVHSINTGTATFTNKTINDLSNYIDADATHLKVFLNIGSSSTVGMPLHATTWNAINSAIEVDKADADNNMPAVCLAEQAAADGSIIECRVQGVLNNVNTNAWSEGVALYVSPTAGTLTTTRPTGVAQNVQRIATVVRQHATLGVIEVQGAGRTNDVPNTISITGSITASNVTGTNTGDSQPFSVMTGSTSISQVPGLQYISDSEQYRFCSGLASGGTITAISAGTFTVTAGIGFVNDHTGSAKKVTWNDMPGVSVIGDGTNYICIDSDGNISVELTKQLMSNHIYLGHVYVIGGNIIETWNVPEWTGHYQGRMNEFVAHALGTMIPEGNIVTEQTTSLKLSISAGEMYARLGEFETLQTTTFTKMYNNNGTWTVDSSSSNYVDVAQYNNITTGLVTMTTGSWKKDLILRVPNGNVYYIFGQAEYDTEEAALQGAIPDVPTTISEDSGMLAVIVLQKDDVNIGSRIHDIRPNLDRVFGFGTSSSGSLIDHGTLGGLDHDDHPQYHNDTRGDLRYSSLASFTTHTTATSGVNAHGIGTMAAETAANYSTTIQADALYTTPSEVSSQISSSNAGWGYQTESQVVSIVTSSISDHAGLTTGVHGAGANSFIYSNDARLTDARTPTAHSQAFSTITGSVPLASAVSGSLPWANISTSYPTFNQSTSGTAAGLSAVLVLASGGTNSTLANCAGNDFVRMNAGKTALECATISGGGDMLKSENLSGLADYTTARSNLGLGTMATAATADYSTTVAANALYAAMSHTQAYSTITSVPATAQTLTCGTTDKFSAYQANTGIFTCTADESGSGGAGIVGPGTSVDGEVVLYSGTTGSLLKRASGTGGVILTSGVASVAKMPIRVWTSANQTFSSTTAAASTYLTFPVVVGTYSIDCWLPATDTATSAIRYAIALPASSTIIFNTSRRTASATAYIATDNITAQWASTCTGCTAAVTASVNTTSPKPNRLFGWFTTTNTGTATIYVADSTNGQNNILLKGAWCEYVRQ